MLWWQKILPLISVFSLFHPFTFAQGKLDSVQHVQEIVVVSKPAMRWPMLCAISPASN